MDLIPGQCWHPAVEDGGLREGARAAAATGMIDLCLAGRVAADPAQGTPAPRRARLTFTDVDGHRVITRDGLVRAARGLLGLAEV